MYLNVNGINPSMTAFPNPCTFPPSSGFCSTTIKVNAPGYTNPQIFANDTPMTGAGIDPHGTYPTGTWISTSGVTFKLKSNGSDIASLLVKGISMADSNLITASPNPCVLSPTGFALQILN